MRVLAIIIPILKYITKYKNLPKSTALIWSEIMKDSQRAAKKRYRAKVEVLQVELYPTDADIKDKLKTVGAKATYIKKLIREDIRREV